MFDEIQRNQNKEKTVIAKELRREQEEAEKIRKKITVMEEKIPDAMSGEYLHYLLKNWLL